MVARKRLTLTTSGEPQSVVADALEATGTGPPGWQQRRYAYSDANARRTLRKSGCSLANDDEGRPEQGMVRDHGVEIEVDSGQLRLKATAEPPPSVVEVVKRHKAEIVTLISAEHEALIAEDWQAFYGERAAICEHDGEVSREAAGGYILSLLCSPK